MNRQPSQAVGMLMKRDPELLDFALGALFRYDPPT